MLAAGSLGSPLIARASGLANGSGLAGRGLTDHPIYVVPFSIPRSSSWFRETDSSMTLSRPEVAAGADGRPSHPYNVKLSLNTKLTQSRFVDPEAFIDSVDEDRMPCELVFLLDSELLDANQVTPDPLQPNLPVVTMAGRTVDQHLQKEIDAYADAVLAAFDGQGGARQYAPLGGVGHEVGTMRMTSTGVGGAPQGVVDEQLRVIGCTNVYVCDLSVFASSPAANPTLTLVALALRLAAHLGT